MILGLEWSSRRLSVALGFGEATQECSLELPRFRAPEALELVDRLFRETDCRMADLEEIRIGRGPGNYSGVRQAFSWAAGACAPGGIRLRAVTSGQAQAVRLCQEEDSFWILGDARRGMWWGAKAGPDMVWELRSPEAWRVQIGDGRVFSAEAERLEGLPGLVEEMPAAADLLNLAADALADPCEPLYLHPPVSEPSSSRSDKGRP